MQAATTAAKGYPYSASVEMVGREQWREEVAEMLKATEVWLGRKKGSTFWQTSMVSL